MIAIKKPPGFISVFGVVGCFVKCKGEILLLKRQKGKREPLTWGVPAGKIDKGESLPDAMRRELFEETGILRDVTDFRHMQKVYTIQSDLSFEFHMFSLVCIEKPQIVLHSEEHIDFCWVTPQKALQLNLMKDLSECICVVDL